MEGYCHTRGGPFRSNPFPGDAPRMTIPLHPCDDALSYQILFRTAPRVEWTQHIVAGCPYSYGGSDDDSRLRGAAQPGTPDPQNYLFDGEELRDDVAAICQRIDDALPPEMRLRPPRMTRVSRELR